MADVRKKTRHAAPEDVEEQDQMEEEELPEGVPRNWTEAMRREPPVQQDLVLEWEALERPYRPLNREMFSTIVAGAFFFGVILFFIDGIFVVMMLVSLLFLWYVLGTVKPRKIVHTMTTWGIETENKLWSWDYMVRYWFEGEKESRMVVIELVTWWPKHLRLVIDSKETEEVLDNVLSELLVKDQPKPNWLDKASKWVGTKIRWTAS